MSKFEFEVNSSGEIRFSHTSNEYDRLDALGFIKEYIRRELTAQERHRENVVNEVHQKLDKLLGEWFKKRGVGDFQAVHNEVKQLNPKLLLEKIITETYGSCCGQGSFQETSEYIAKRDKDIAEANAELEQRSTEEFEETLDETTKITETDETIVIEDKIGRALVYDKQTKPATTKKGKGKGKK